VYDITAAAIVRRVREEAQLSQRELAARANTSQAVVARIESGASDPAFSTVARLADAAGSRLEVTIAPKMESDPVVEAYKPGVDKTLLIENLRKTPQERIDQLIAAERTAAEFRRAGQEARRRVAEAEAKYDAYRKPR
jgi:predicted transcriptional regulator